MYRFSKPATRVLAGALACAWFFARPCAADPTALRVTEIARGHSWVSPYWGYSTPKIVFDGKAYYTAGLWGDKPEQATGVVYRYAKSAWHEGATLPEIYQPATLLLDSQKRLLVIYTRQSKPAVFLRGKTPGSATDFEELPAPADMPTAYYLGAAIDREVLYVAYLTSPAYTMYINRLDLEKRQWSTAAVVAEGQVETKPKTAWTYPILVPAKDGLHLVASNCPDGGEGNTYNQVWHVVYRDDLTEALREKVAESPVGSNAYAMDAAVERDGTVHIVHMWNHRKYGDPLPEGSAPEGTYDSSREPKTGAWQHARLAPLCLAGFHQNASELHLITEEEGTFVASKWDASSRAWTRQGPLMEPSALPGPPTFMDVLRDTSGSVVSPQPAIVTDSPTSDTRVLWAIGPFGD